ncbi:hypothetical protein V2O64_14390 [Verrucomicrobiaceae bacterium 227]
MNSRSFKSCLSRKSLCFLALILLGCLTSLSLIAGKDRDLPVSASARLEGGTVLTSRESAPAVRAERNKGNLSVAQATAIAVNRISTEKGVVQLTHPRHVVQFDEKGLTFTPRLGGPVWNWQNESAGQVIPSEKEGASPVVSYSREGISEEYLAKIDCVEQRFILQEFSKEDFVVSGRIECEGRFEEYAQGWQWRSEEGGVVSLGGVTVFDAEGTKLPATMTVTADRSEIFVAGEALALATFPVTVDPEIGTNDFRVSHSVDDYAKYFEAAEPDVVYNSTRNEYLVIWRADGTVGDRLLNEYEIFGQRIDAGTGALVGDSQFVISETFEDGDTNSVYPRTPAVSYNPVADEYLAIWITSSSEIRGQRLEGETGANIGDDFVINESGDEGTVASDLAFSPEANRFLVVWSGYQDGGGLVRNENEIFGRFVDHVGATTGGTIRLSDMGPDGDGAYDALFPAIAYSDGGRFLVVWEGDDLSGALVNGESEIFGQLVDAETMMEVGPNDFRISQVAEDGDTSKDAGSPAVAFDPVREQFLVVWEADTGAGSLGSSEVEIYGQFIADVTGLETGADDFRISFFGNDDGSSADSVSSPEVIYQAEENAFVVAWHAPEVFVGGAREEEIFGQVIDAATGAAVGVNTRMSDMGPDGDDSFGAKAPFSMVSGPGDGIFFCWSGTDDQFGLFPGEKEIFIQPGRVDGGLLEVGVNDNRISDAGSNGDNISDAFNPALAYNSKDDHYLVVWENPGAGGAFSLERVFGNRIDGTTGERLHEDDFIVDQSNGGGSFFGENQDPAVAYNTVQNEFLIVWTGFGRNDDDHSGSSGEMFVRRMNGGTGEFLSDEQRISSVGEKDNSQIDGANPDVAYDALHNQYLVVWESDSDAAPLVNNEFEIYGQHLSGVDASEIGVDDFRISVTGTDGDDDRDALNASVAFNGVDFLAVWQADGGAFDDKNEIYGGRISGSSGTLLSVTKLSTTGPANDSTRVAENPAVCASLDAEADNGFLVVWQADIVTPGDFQIYGRYDLEGAAATPEIFTVSDVAGATGVNPACVYDPASGQYIVVWESIPDGAGDGSEIRGQYLAPVTGEPSGLSGFLLSDMGPNNDPDFNAHTPVVGVNSSNGKFLTVWSGDDHENGRLEEEFEIFGQFYEGEGADILGLVIFGNNVVVSFRGVADSTYQLQSSLDLSNWQTQAAQMVATGGIDELTQIGGVDASRKFWRVISVSE